VTPGCTQVLGTAALTFTTDFGRTRKPTQFALPANHYTIGLVSLATPNVLLALGDDGRSGLQLQRSRDAGCSWSRVNTPIDPSFWYGELVASGDTVYAWNPDVPVIYHIAGDGTVTRVALGFAPKALVVDRGDPNHLRAATLTAAGMQLMDARDRGQSWVNAGSPPNDLYFQFNVVLSSTNLDHALALSARGGAWVTLDGGNQWQRSAGFDDVPFPNGRSGAIGVDEQTVWLLIQDSPPVTTTPRAAGVYVSHDGGFNFVRVASESAVMPLNHGGTTFWPAASDPNVVYFSYDDISPGAPSYLYRYDAAAAAFSSTSWPSREGGVYGLAFHPTNSGVLYLALSFTCPSCPQYPLTTK